MNDPKQILVARDGPVARVTINRPERRNAISFAAWQSLAASFDNLAADPGVRVVVLTGAGDRAFCAGNDISEFAEKRSTPEQIDAYDSVATHAYQVIRGIEKPLIARVRGFAVGGGFELMQLCDLQIVSAGARFAMTPARLGLGYKLADVQLLVDRIGPRAAREMLFTGRLFDATEAQHMELVTRVVPDEDLDATVDACAAEIAANAPLSVRAIKVAIGEALKPPPDRDRERCDALAAACNESEDYREGQRAFAQRRSRSFAGGRNRRQSAKTLPAMLRIHNHPPLRHTGAGDARRARRGVRDSCHLDGFATGGMAPRSIPAEFGVDDHFSRYKNHFACWKTLSNGDVAIATVLHERMHQIGWLREELAD